MVRIECQCIFDQVLEVFGQATATIEPCQGALDHPTHRQHDEAFGLVRSLDDLYRQMWQELRHSIGKLRSLVASVSKQPGQNGYIPNSVDSSSTPPSRSWISPGCTFAGKKRHILVDTLGLLLHAIVHPANIQDRDGGVLLLSTLFGMYPFLVKLFADAGYQGTKFADAVAKHLPHLAIEIVKRSHQAKGFVVLPMRWVVERTLAWLNRCRRLAKDFENLTDNALAFLRLASIRLMLRRLCNPS